MLFRKEFKRPCGFIREFLKDVLSCHDLDFILKEKELVFIVFIKASNFCGKLN